MTACTMLQPPVRPNLMTPLAVSPSVMKRESQKFWILQTASKSADTRSVTVGSSR